MPEDNSYKTVKGIKLFFHKQTCNASEMTAARAGPLGDSRAREGRTMLISYCLKHFNHCSIHVETVDTNVPVTILKVK